MKLIALKPCPQGQQPGTIFTAPDVHGQILIHAGAAQEVADDEPQPFPSLDPPRLRRRYRRRDLTAES